MATDTTVAEIDAVVTCEGTMVEEAVSKNSHSFRPEEGTRPSLNPKQTYCSLQPFGGALPNFGF